MRVSTYAKKFQNIVKNRPHFESEAVEAIVTLTGADFRPMVDLKKQSPEDADAVISIDLEEAKRLAQWIKSL